MYIQLISCYKISYRMNIIRLIICVFVFRRFFSDKWWSLDKTKLNLFTLLIPAPILSVWIYWLIVLSIDKTNLLESIWRLQTMSFSFLAVHKWNTCWHLIKRTWTAKSISFSSFMFSHRIKQRNQFPSKYATPSPQNCLLKNIIS